MFKSIQIFFDRLLAVVLGNREAGPSIDEQFGYHGCDGQGHGFATHGLKHGSFRNRLEKLRSVWPLVQMPCPAKAANFRLFQDFTARDIKRRLCAKRGAIVNEGWRQF